MTQPDSADNSEKSANRLLCYLLDKLEEEPLAYRASLCEDLAQFWPNETGSVCLKNHAVVMRRLDGHLQSIREQIGNPLQNNLPPT